MSLSRISSVALVIFGCAWQRAMAEPKPSVNLGVLACGFFGAGPAEADGADIAAQVRDMLCFFKLRSGAEETYSGKLLSVSLGEQNETLLWLVKAPFTETAPAPGLLQQSYEPDAKSPQDQAHTLVGEANAAIILQSMADNSEKGTSAPGKSPAGDLAILRLELTLHSSVAEEQPAGFGTGNVSLLSRER
jgi:hypothetical protein